MKNKHENTHTNDSAPTEAPDEAPRSKGSTTRLFRWIDERTGAGDLMHESLDEPIPGGARLAYVFGSGLLFIFISQIITGICLALYYVPSAESAHTSVAYISKKVAGGAFLRSLHSYGSSAMIVVLVLHFLQTFLYGSFKGRRELLWMSGAFLALLVLGMGFTGYLLPWDQKAYFATAVGTNIVGEVPFIGEWLTRLLRGGDTLGTLTISRFYVAHVFLIPAMIFGFIAAHIALFRKAGPAGPINEDPVAPKLPPEGFYPRQVIMDMAFALLLIAALGVLAYFHPVQLGPVANPADTQFLPRPEWYYLPMFEWLKFWEGPQVVFAIVVVPGILALLFFLLPFLDRGLERRPWRRPIPLLSVCIVLVGTIYLGMRSHLDDKHDPTVAAQLARQAQEEKAYDATPFQPEVEAPGGAAAAEPASGASVDPRVPKGRGIFEANGCSGCHGSIGQGSPAAPSLVGITAKIPADRLIALLHNPNAAMHAGGMPAVDLGPSDMSALLAYLNVIGTSAANVQATHGETSTARVPSAPIRTRTSAPAMTSAGATQSPAAAPVEAGNRVIGAQLFQSHACFACHGESGRGGRAPALGPLVAGLSDAQVSGLLQLPSAPMRAGGMAAFSGTQRQLTDLVAYLRSLAASAHEASPSAEPESPSSTSAPLPAVSPARQNSAAAAQVLGSVESERSAVTPQPSGRTIFADNGCAACHGTVGQGTHFAPSLIGIGKTFPGAQLASLLRHPTRRMKDGGMPSVTVSDPQLQQLVAYLDSLSTAEPAPPSSAAPGLREARASGQPSTGAGVLRKAELSPLELAGQKVFHQNRCQSCHGIDGVGGTIAAPGLAGTASILPPSTLESLLRHHSKAMQQGGMPLTNMSAADMKALVLYIRSMPSE